MELKAEAFFVTFATRCDFETYFVNIVLPEELEVFRTIVFFLDCTSIGECCKTTVTHDSFIRNKGRGQIEYGATKRRLGGPK